MKPMAFNGIQTHDFKFIKPNALTTTASYYILHFAYYFCIYAWRFGPVEIEIVVDYMTFVHLFMCNSLDLKAAVFALSSSTPLV